MEYVNGEYIFRVNNGDKGRYSIRINKETILSLYDEMLLLGLNNPNKDDDLLTLYFDAVKDYTKPKNNVIVEEKKIIEIICELQKSVKEMLSDVKITKQQITCIVLSIMLASGLITLNSIKKSIDTTSRNNIQRKVLLDTAKEEFLDNDYATPTNRKGYVEINEGNNYTNFLTGDITPTEAYMYISLIRESTKDTNAKLSLIDEFITSQTYNNGTKNYLSWKDYLYRNGFANEQEFVDYCFDELNKKNSLKKVLN